MNKTTRKPAQSKGFRGDAAQSATTGDLPQQMCQNRAGEGCDRDAKATIDSPSRQQRKTLPISAVFFLRYLRLPDAEWGPASTPSGRKLRRKAPGEMLMGRMGIQRLDSAIRTARGAAVLGACLALANCASSGKFASRVDPKY